MSKMNKVVHFEIPADDLARARKFYQDVFGWKTQDVPGMDYVMATTAETGDNMMMPKEPGAINGGMMKRSDMVKGPSLAVDVENIDNAIEKVRKMGGTLLTKKMEVGQMGYMAYFKDTEGNVLSLWQAVVKK